jgi:predicted O-methyltransferase YrrM
MNPAMTNDVEPSTFIPRFEKDFTGAVRNLWPLHVFPELDRSKPITWLEIGSFEGRSALWTIENMLLHPDSRIVCVDPWIPWANFAGHALFNFEEHFDHNLGGRPQVDKRKGTSKEILPTLPSCSFDGCYIDGPHDKDNVLSDAKLTLPLLKPGSILVFDDYGRDGDPGVKLAVDELIVEWGNRAKTLHLHQQAIFKMA